MVFVKKTSSEVNKVIKKEDTVVKSRNRVHPIPTIIISDYSSTEKDKREIVIHPKGKGKNKCKKFYIRISN